MSIGPDIKEVFEELGTAIIIHKPDGTIVSNEFMDYDDTFHDASTELQRQFALTGSLAYDSKIIIGDIIKFVNHEELYITIGVKPSYFEDLYVTKEVYLLRCNTVGMFCRKTEIRNENLEVVTDWVELFEHINAVQFERGTNTEAEEFTDVMEISIGTQLLYVSSFDIQIGDRWYPNELDREKYFRIDTIHTRRFSNGQDACYLCFLADDTRE